MRLSEYAKKMNITYRTAWSWYKSGKIKNAYQTESGTIMVEDETDKDIIIRLQKEKIEQLEAQLRNHK